MDHVGVYILITVCVLITGQQYTTTTEIDFITVEDISAPSKPVNIMVISVTANSIYLKWLEPLHANGPIGGYRVYFMHNNYTDVRTFKIDSTVTNIKFNLTRLKPDTEYVLRISAFTGRFEGEPSEPVVNKTDISGPSPPKILNLTCEAEDSIYIKWERPTEFYNTIDYYYIYLYYSDDTLLDNITLPTSKDYLELTYSITNLTTDIQYGIEIEASSYSNYSDKLLSSPKSELKKIHLHLNCEKIQDFMKRTTADLSVGMIAGLVCAIVAFFLTLTAFIVWRKCFYVRYYYLENVRVAIPATSLTWNEPPQEEGEYRGPVIVSEFKNHVVQLHADGDIGFSREYEAIQALQEAFISNHSQHVDNKPKNRYLNIIAYDHSRVQLLRIPGRRRNIDYINANYIDGFQCTKAFIGTQGPLPSTFDSFWRMIWEQRVTIIVMITNLVERGRRKCDMYWPKETSETYGIIQVKLVREDIMATYTVRTLLIKHLKIKKRSIISEKLVYQYHYTNWPDHGTPDHPLNVLHFVKKSSAANPSDAGPIIVHCSAGVGRTGTYIVLDAMLRQIRNRNEINIFGFLKHIRSQRNFLVQTEEQYIFIHDALLEIIDSGETNINREQIPRYVEALRTNTTETECDTWKSLEVQFELATNFEPRDFNLVSAHKPINQPKNRSHIVPLENSRVHLTPKPGEDGSDYVNATWLQGFQSLREFIVTQHPLKETVNDFWQMVWDHNAHTIVMLSKIDNEEFEIFWPMEQESIVTENFQLKLANEHTQYSFVLRDFTMQSIQDDYEIHVHMIYCTNWPHHCSVSEIYQLPNIIQDKLKGLQNGPIVVVDRFGGAEAATFCCLTTVKKQLLYENHADIYMYAKLYHNKRPGIWAKCEDYLRMHLAVQAVCSPPEETADLYVIANGIINESLSDDGVCTPLEGIEMAGRKVSVA